MENPAIVEKFQLTEQSAIAKFYCTTLSDYFAKLGVTRTVSTRNLGNYLARRFHPIFLFSERIQTLEDQLVSKKEEKSQIAELRQKLNQLECKTENLANSQKTVLSLNIYLSLFLSMLLIAFFVYTEVFVAKRKTLTVW